MLQHIDGTEALRCSAHTPATVSELDSPSMMAGTKILLNRRRWKRPTLPAIEQAQSVTRRDVGSNSPSTQGFVTLKRSANRDSPTVRMMWSTRFSMICFISFSGTCTDSSANIANMARKSTHVKSAPLFVKLEHVGVVQRVFVRDQL